MNFTPFSIVSVFSAEFLENAEFPIEITLPGILTDLRFPHFQNAYCPIPTTLSGISIDSIKEFAKAQLPIYLTEEGMTTALSFPLYFTSVPFSSISKSDRETGAGVDAAGTLVAVAEGITGVGLGGILVGVGVKLVLEAVSDKGGYT